MGSYLGLSDRYLEIMKVEISKTDTRIRILGCTIIIFEAILAVIPYIYYACEKQEERASRQSRFRE